MKLGNVYKITEKGKSTVGVVVELRTRSFNNDMIATVCTTNGSIKKFYVSEIQTSSTRLKPEIRECFTKIYQQFVEEAKLKKQMEALEDKMRKRKEQKNKAIDNLKKKTDEFNIDELSRSFYEISGWCCDPKKYSVSFFIKDLLDRGPFVKDYPFVVEEYDGSLYTHETPENIKKYGIKLSKEEVQMLKKLPLKCMKFDSVSDEFFFGDKRRLYASKNFNFTFKKDCKHSEAVKDCKKIQKWIQAQQAKLREY